MSNLREKMEIENKENMAHKNDSFIRRLGKLYLYRNKKKRVNSCINLRKAGNFFFLSKFPSLANSAQEMWQQMECVKGCAKCQYDDNQ